MKVQKNNPSNDIKLFWYEINEFSEWRYLILHKYTTAVKIKLQLYHSAFYTSIYKNFPWFLGIIFFNHIEDNKFPNGISIKSIKNNLVTKSVLFPIFN